jgi:hypothetical protein
MKEKIPDDQHLRRLHDGPALFASKLWVVLTQNAKNAICRVPKDTSL